MVWAITLILWLITHEKILGDRLKRWFKVKRVEPISSPPRVQPYFVPVEDKPLFDNRPHFEFNPTIEVNPVISTRTISSSSSKDISRPESPRTKPNLTLLLPTKTKRIRKGIGLHGEFGGFYDGDSDNPYAAVACFRNRSTPLGVAPVYGARAAIIYRDSQGQEIGDGVSSAFWMGDFRDINFEAEQTHCVIVVMLDGDGIPGAIFQREIPHWMGPSVHPDGYEIGKSLKSIELVILHENSRLIEPIIFDFSIERGQPVITPRLLP